MLLFGNPAILAAVLAGLWPNIFMRSKLFPIELSTSSLTNLTKARERGTMSVLA